jgi:hypothetical protein
LVKKKLKNLLFETQKNTLFVSVTGLGGFQAPFFVVKPDNMRGERACVKQNKRRVFRQKGI